MFKVKKEKYQRNVLGYCFNLFSFALITHDMERIRSEAVNISITAFLFLLRFQKVTLIGDRAFLSVFNCKCKLFQNT